MDHLKYLEYYIHHNPVHHGFSESMFDYSWSSFLTITTPLKTKLKRKEVLEWYKSVNHFMDYHSQHNIIHNSDLHLDSPQ